MKKLLLVVLFCLMVVPLGYSADYTANVYASWVQVQPSSRQEIFFPFNSRNLYIRNGSSVPIYVDLRTPKNEGTITSATCDSCVLLDADSEVTLRNYVSSGVTIAAATTVASPVTVISTY